MSSAIKRTIAQSQHVGIYDAVASEYYVADWHPTCDALGEASAALLIPQMRHLELQNANICDVGAGRSIALQAFGNFASSHKFWLVDSSPKMLAWNDGHVNSDVKLIVRDACELDLLNVDFDLIVAGLGDPYNTEKFWFAVANSLGANGACLFTTPSFEWSSSFRTAIRGESENSALFVLRDGSSHQVPSFVYSVEDQLRLIESVGLSARGVVQSPVHSLRTVPPKMAHLHSSAPAVTLYIVGR